MPNDMGTFRVDIEIENPGRTRGGFSRRIHPLFFLRDERELLARSVRKGKQIQVKERSKTATAPFLADAKTQQTQQTQQWSTTPSD